MICDCVLKVPDFNNRNILDKTSNFITKSVLSILKSNKLRFYFNHSYWEKLDINEDNGQDDSYVYKIRKLYFYSTSENCSPIGELNIKLENSEYFDLINIQFICNSNFDRRDLEGMMLFEKPNILFLTCTSPVHMAYPFYLNQMFYLKLSKTIRHELQHSYQSFFLTDEDLSERLKYNHKIYGLNETYDELLRQEITYMHDKTELDAFFHTYKYIAKKTNTNFYDLIENVLEKRKENILSVLSFCVKGQQDYLDIKKGSDAIFIKIKKKILDFDKKYGHLKTCF